MRDHVCEYESAPRGDYLRCKTCGDRFPCKDKDCGHHDCIEERGQLSLCHYCRERVTGPPDGFSIPSSLVPELRQADPQGTWTTWAVWGHARTVHYKCRDAHASAEDLKRWYGQNAIAVT